MAEQSFRHIPPFNVQDEESLFRIFTTTHAGVENDPEEYFPKHVHGMGFCICLEGEVQMSIDLRHYVIRADEMFILLPETVVQPISRSDDFVGYVFRLEPDWIDDIDSTVGVPFYLTIRNNPCLSLNREDMQTVMELCDLIKQKAQRSGHPFRKEIAQHLILGLIYEICAICQHGQPLRQKARNRREELFERFLYLVTTHYRMQRGLNFYAEQMCLTPKYLSTIIKQASDASATEWITWAVIRNAKSLLETSKLTVQQIADYLNFPTPSFFGQYFKKHVGTTPKEFRQQKR